MTEKRRHRLGRGPVPPTPAQVLGPAAGIVALLLLLLVGLVASPGSFVVRVSGSTAAERTVGGSAATDDAEPTAPPVPSPQAAPPRQDPQLPTQAMGEQALDALEELLQVRDRAVDTGDAAAWQTTLGTPDDGVAGADGGFAVLTSLPVTRFESSLVPDSLRPVAPDDAPEAGEVQADPGQAGQPEGPVRWQARVQTDYELARGPAVRRTDTVQVGPAASPAVGPVAPGGWRVESWEPFPATGGMATRAPWELGPVQATVAERAVVLSWASDGSGAATGPALSEAQGWGARVAGWVDLGAVTVDSYLGTGWPRVTLVLAPATAAQYDALVPGAAREGSDVFAAVTTDIQTPDGGGDLVVLNPSARPELVAETWQVTVTHELVHVASGARYGDTQEVWLAEGLADLVGWSGVVPGTVSREQVAGRLLQRVAAGDADIGSLPDSDAFAAGDADRVGDAYEGSWLAVLLLQDEIGVDGVLELYAQASDGPGTARQRTGRALREATGQGRAEFQDRWSSHVTGLAGGG